MSRFLAKLYNQFWRKSNVRLGVLITIFAVAVLGILLADFRVNLQVGQVSTKDIDAPRQIVNRYQTNILREEAADQAAKEAANDPANYEITPDVAKEAEEALGTLFEWASVLRTGRIPVTDEVRFIEGEEPNQKSERTTDGEELSVSERALWLQREAERWLNISITNNTAVRLLVTDPASLSALEEAAVASAVRVLSKRRISSDTLGEAKSAAAEGVDIAPLSSADRAAAADLASSVIVPNLSLNTEKIERVRQQAADSVAPVMIRRGETIVYRGEQITEEHVQILEDLGLRTKTPSYLVLLGVVVLVLIWIGLIGTYLKQFTPEILRSEGLLALLGLIIIIVTFTAKVLSLIPWEGAGYLIPVAFGSMLISLLLDSRVAVLAVVFLSVVIGIVTGGGPFLNVALVGGLTGIYSVSKVSFRSDVTRAGLVVGAANVAAMVALALANEDGFAIRNAYLGLANGIVSAIGTIGFLPYLESIFGITSSLRLLELSNPNQPLLRKLLMDAPGTYHHSVIVGNLAEAAADAIGADGLLARVGAHYHDIGKLRRPYFFIENQIASDNPHEKIAPSLSTLIITSHVKDGIELAKQYKLPNALVEFIQQHHGTDLVKYFFHRAAESGKEETVEEKDFRYPGPRPQTKETAIVMLADSVEAAVRSLSRPTPGRIEGLVRKIIKSRLNEGQLDESELTLRDLNRIGDAFTRVLSGIFHNRVEYPEEVTKEDITGEKDES